VETTHLHVKQPDLTFGVLLRGFLGGATIISPANIVSIMPSAGEQESSDGEGLYDTLEARS
jgi:hypothetical protein